MKQIVILLCKLAALIGKCLHRGSSLPGKIALKLRPGILSELTLPEHVVAVTGSNGKTSTVEMIAFTLTAAGKRVVWNREGSNQIEGVATLLLKNASLSGVVRGDVVVLECDERYARHTFRSIKPTLFVITNLYRDQLTRNGHPFWIYDIVQQAVSLAPQSTLLLNADDPIVRRFGQDRENTIYFGMAQNRYSTPQTDALYNDCTYCPVCHAPLRYRYFHYAHLGAYHCEGCGYARPDTAFTVDALDLDEKTISINGNAFPLAFASRYNVYNLCAAFAVCALLGVEEAQAASTLGSFLMKSGRVVHFTAGQNQGLLLASKHENSTSYNQNLAYISRERESCTLAVLVDAVSRKYYTAETSWLWDISFEMLKDSAVRRILLCGKYAYDLAVRFEQFSLPGVEIIVEPDLDRMGALFAAPETGKLYVMTCFSDKSKVLDRVTVVPQGR